MEGTESVRFFGSESPSSTPSPASTPSPPALSGVGGGIRVASATAAAGEEVSMTLGMGMGTGMMGSYGSAGEEEFVRKKSGRPRKDEQEGMDLALTARSSLPFSPSSDFSGKRGRGRPRGSGKRQLLAALGEWFVLSAGGNFTPHVVTIETGEDLATRILSFSQKGPRAICILSANGAISNVTLRQPGSSGGTLTYEGRFEILTLSGSFTISDSGGIQSRTGGISVSLAGPDGRVIGGGVAGLLLAASPIQVVVGSFMPNAFKEKKKLNSEDQLPFSSTHMSQATVDEEYVTPKSALPDKKKGDFLDNANSSTDLNPSSFQTVRWQGLQPPSENKPSPSPDINICLHGD